MPIFLAALGGVLINIAGTIAGRVLIGLGIGVATYTGINATLTALKAQAIASFNGLPGDVLGMLGYMKVGQCISIIMSAIAARMMINGLSGDTFKKWVMK